MADVSHALQELGFTGWVLRGEPTTSDEFASMFRIITGKMTMVLQSNQPTRQIGP